MIFDRLLQSERGIFHYCEVTIADVQNKRVKAQSGDFLAWIDTDLSLNIGDTVIVAVAGDGKKFIVRSAANIRPTLNTLMSL